MEVRIIDEKRQEFNGKRYWRDKSTGYYRNARVKPHSLHRQVWIHHYGNIPAGLVIDHIDRDKNNNQIDNLRLVSHSDNAKNISAEELERRREWAKQIRPLTKKWHQSEEGRRWHREHGIETSSKRKPIKKTCAHCGKEYYTTQYAKSARFCHPNCKMKARRRRLAGLPENAKDLKSY